jgi:hypothetical protein
MVGGAGGLPRLETSKAPTTTEELMAKRKKAQNKQADAPPAAPTLPYGRAHLIRIPDLEARRRAAGVLGSVPFPHCGFSDHRFLVLNEHLEVLRREGIPFEDIT